MKFALFVFALALISLNVQAKDCGTLKDLMMGKSQPKTDCTYDATGATFSNTQWGTVNQAFIADLDVGVNIDSPTSWGLIVDKEYPDYEDKPGSYKKLTHYAPKKLVIKKIEKYEHPFFKVQMTAILLQEKK